LSIIKRLNHESFAAIYDIDFINIIPQLIQEFTEKIYLIAPAQH